MNSPIRGFLTSFRVQVQIQGNLTGFRVQVPPRTHIQVPDLRLYASPYDLGTQSRRSQTWGFKSLSDTSQPFAHAAMTPVPQLTPLRRA